MIDHVRKNKGKTFLYVLPVTPYPYNKIKTYIILKVIIKEIYNKFSICLIDTIINEDWDFSLYGFFKENKIPIGCSNQYLFELEETKGGDNNGCC